MPDVDRSEAEKDLQVKLATLEADLERTLKVGAEINAAIDEAKQRTKSLVERQNEIGQQEGRLRGAIGEVQRTLEALRMS